ncbi:MAG: hypothetical protein JST00_44560 [Deltaproteobacteria bacterium]|nr:hypothetical protein [Deltaproteobacteria bacterium]
MTRALRILLVANDGLSAGHVTRTLAIARALRGRSEARGLEVRLALATTSEADGLLATEPLALVRMPSPAAGRRAGLSDAERRRLVRGCIESVVSTFAPDLVVVDTFPLGPHGELAGLGDAPAKRALVRRDVPEERLEDDALASGLAGYDLAILAADPTPLAREPLLPHGKCVHVPPIVLGRLLPRAEARAALGLAEGERTILVTAGGGGDAEATARAERIAEAVTKARVGGARASVFVARGPLARDAGARARTAWQLGEHMAAFDGAIAAAGYNTAHELARAGVPAALFASPRSFDDQAARAKRFEREGLAIALERDDGDGIAQALAWMATAPRKAMAADGASAAADALLELATSRGAP